MELQVTQSIILVLDGGATHVQGARDAFKIQEAYEVPVEFIHNGKKFGVILQVVEK